STLARLYAAVCPMKSVDVYKYGGVAVGSAEALRTAAGHVARGARTSGPQALDLRSGAHRSAGRPEVDRLRTGGPRSIIVVLSAMSGITDLLHGAARAALDGQAFESAAAEFASRHVALARDA